MSDEHILVEWRNQIGVITFNRPAVRNALTEEMWDRFPHLVKQVAADPKVRVIVLRGAGDTAFAAGADIRELDEALAHPESAIVHRARVEAAMRSLEDCPKPVLAMVAGFAMGGGCRLAIACDLRIAADNAQFGIPSAKLGYVISYECTRRLMALVGPGRTAQMLLTAQPIKAQEAYQIGLVEFLVPLADLESTTFGLAEDMAKLSPTSLATAKEMIRALARDPDMDRITDRTALLRRCLEGPDFREGVRAFKEKRPPKFGAS
jgi:enoyl-CoA hydratase/carnithine racemase